MRALLDVNVLIALLDSSHVHHKQVTDWLISNIDQGWASCPITQNGSIRILSQPSYPNSVAAKQVADRLAEATLHPAHQFWPDAISLLNTDLLNWEWVLSSRQVTDVYLLALAVQQGSRFVTLDRGIAINAVAGASADHLLVIL